MNYLENIDKAKLMTRAKPLAIAGIIFVAVFAAGYGVGKSSGSGGSGSAATKRSLNYTTTQAGEQNVDKSPTTPTTQPATTPPPDASNCYIKGSKSKLYHLPGGAFYERTTPAACFNTEAEAQAAGYKKSSR